MLVTTQTNTLDKQDNQRFTCPHTSGQFIQSAYPHPVFLGWGRIQTKPTHTNRENKQTQQRKVQSGLMHKHFTLKMETKRLKRDVQLLISNYVGQKILENSFDPSGRGRTTVLDDLVQYDLDALWLSRDSRHVLDADIIGAICSLGSPQHPNRLQREAMILSCFAGIIMSRLPVEKILALYRCKPVVSLPSHQSKGSIVCPLTLSYHPFAMLRSYKAVQHAKRHNQKLKRWLSEQAKARAPKRPVPPPSSSPSLPESFLSESSGCHQEAAEHYEGSQESLQD
ncbi:uncharacterized protein C2orf80-like isoform X2 [Xiphophorus couchianus]|uniref:uncharacterized protein C2orf80-like isoform X2 n=1 Tax=Xiphophorus couchianus TaxID=32473 RepID=UPI0010166B08|nr:uncharacterized protein C2orf80-like isoform X2 [Xiphophorus couchianus]